MTEKGFVAVTLSWKGVEYVVPATKQMGLIDRLETALGGEDGTPAMVILTRKNGPGTARLSMAYGAALRYAGAYHVTDEDVYLTIMRAMAKSDASIHEQVQSMVLSLMQMVCPPIGWAMDDAEEGDTPEKSMPAPDGSELSTVS